MICACCITEKLLIKAHVIPKKFYDTVKGNEKKVLFADANDPSQIEQWQNGLHDCEILCSECDARLGKLDAIGYTHFKEKPLAESAIVGTSGEVIGYSLERAEISKMSVVTSKPASRGHFKTSHPEGWFGDRIR